MDKEQVYAAIAAERRELADALAGLTDNQWATPSLCGAWTVRGVAAHLIAPLINSPAKFIPAILKAKGSFDKASVAVTADVIERHGAELPRLLREQAENRFAPPVLGPKAQLADTVIHGQDIRRPLGISRSFDPERQRTILTFLTSFGAQRAFTPRDRRRDGLRWEATDLAWSSGQGKVVRGTAEAIMLVLSGRPVALAEVTGDGVAQLHG
ncbi:maleylpyruvate isomerase family mycothiol-dependent enzyme [Mycobacteroides chelonae]|uniref:maleylpyruvate isomerase family mycothiol-dependent enzyme n=1 Tax=Mycobacteroides chelonae TaxID=1774 RepID=UPI0008A89810|nr:maleylpyruvate isomerase family mycothiol-dependent enzyme [Mycobacteroides chelonae]OHU63315.1 hypothetical protein BKG85_18175 [Mycobacteroides chelonae]